MLVRLLLCLQAATFRPLSVISSKVRGIGDVAVLLKVSDLQCVCVFVRVGVVKVDAPFLHSFR